MCLLTESLEDKIAAVSDASAFLGRHFVMYKEFAKVGGKKSHCG
jgi:hypothetical protein